MTDAAQWKATAKQLELLPPDERAKFCIANIIAMLRIFPEDVRGEAFSAVIADIYDGSGINHRILDRAPQIRYDSRSRK